MNQWPGILSVHFDRLATGSQTVTSNHTVDFLGAVHPRRPFDLNRYVDNTKLFLQSAAEREQKLIRVLHVWGHQVRGQGGLGGAHCPDVQIVQFLHPLGSGNKLVDPYCVDAGRDAMQ